jgi:hypothetical protein
MTAGPDYDAELEAFLKRRSPMHRRLSDIDHAEPSVELDRLVLNRAREAIETPPAQPLFRSSRWALPVGLAATILIAFTVVLNIDHRGAKVGANTSPVAEAAPESPAPAVARAASTREQERVDSPRVLTDSSAASERRDAQVEKKAEAPAVVAQRAESAAPRDTANASTDSTPLLASSRAGAVKMPPAQPRQQAPGAAASSAPPAVAADAGPRSSPEMWLREITRLRSAGRTADADRELAAFREAYPSHPAYSVAKPPTR